MYADGSCESVSEIDTEQISRNNADLILDIGSHKNKQATELSTLQKDAEIPTLFIDAEVGNLSSAVRFLGELLNYSSRAGQMAAFIDKINTDIQTKKVSIEQKPKVLYDSTDSDFYKNQEYSF